MASSSQDDPGESGDRLSEMDSPTPTPASSARGRGTSLPRATQLAIPTRGRRHGRDMGGYSLPLSRSAAVLGRGRGMSETPPRTQQSGIPSPARTTYRGRLSDTTSSRGLSAGLNTSSPQSSQPMLGSSSMTTSTPRRNLGTENHPGPLTSHPVHFNSSSIASGSRGNIDRFASGGLRQSQTTNNLPVPSTYNSPNSPRTQRSLLPVPETPQAVDSLSSLPSSASIARFKRENLQPESTINDLGARHRDSMELRSTMSVPRLPRLALEDVKSPSRKFEDTSNFSRPYHQSIQQTPPETKQVESNVAISITKAEDDVDLPYGTKRALGQISLYSKKDDSSVAGPSVEAQDSLEMYRSKPQPTLQTFPESEESDDFHAKILPIKGWKSQEFPHGSEQLSQAQSSMEEPDALRIPTSKIGGRLELPVPKQLTSQASTASLRKTSDIPREKPRYTQYPTTTWGQSGQQASTSKLPTITADKPRTQLPQPSTQYDEHKPSGIPKSRTRNLLSNLTSSLSTTNLSRFVRNESRQPSASSVESSKQSVVAGPATAASSTTNLGERRQIGNPVAIEEPYEESPVMFYTAIDPSVWLGRFVSLQDKFKNEMLLPGNLKTITDANADKNKMRDPPSSSQAGTSLAASHTTANIHRTAIQLGADAARNAEAVLLTDEDRRNHRVFVHMAAMCATEEARKSLYDFQQRYARQMDKPQYLPPGGTMQDPPKKGGFFASRIFSGGKDDGKKK
ncbi:hypothetical protein M426DRAFT_267837 [Hypoxylon sp. CI-4A]|nr:hypothetical protein M426DRAFT_267837 [Hypoxylon sp. CI-4A]